MKKLAALLVLLFATKVASAAPHISMDQARKIALARVPGTVMHEKLKKLKKKKKKKAAAGVAHDHYNIKIRPRDNAKPGRWKRVEIDAETGVVLEIKDVDAKSYDD